MRESRNPRKEPGGHLIAWVLAVIVSTLTACAPDGSPVVPRESVPRDVPISAPCNADSWWLRVPVGNSAYVCRRRIDIVVVLESGEECRFPMWAPGMPIVCSDTTRGPSGGPPIVHYLVTYGDVVPWVNPTMARRTEGTNGTDSR